MYEELEVWSGEIKYGKSQQLFKLELSEIISDLHKHKYTVNKNVYVEITDEYFKTIFIIYEEMRMSLKPLTSIRQTQKLNIPIWTDDIQKSNKHIIKNITKLNFYKN